MSFGKTLRILIEERNMTQKELAKQLNLAPSTIGNYIQDVREPDFSTLKVLANYFDVSIDYILNLTNIKEKYSPSKIVNVTNNMNRLNEIRNDLDLLQIEVSKLLKISRPTYSTYETGYSDTPTKVLKTLALYYNVPIDYLLYLTDERKPHKRTN